MAKLTTFIDPEQMPKILGMTIELDNGLTLNVLAGDVENFRIQEWLRPAPTVLLAEVLFQMPFITLDMLSKQEQENDR